MNQHDHDNQAWPWPSREEGGRFRDLLAEPDVRVTEHQQPEMIHAEHPDGRSLWATCLDIRPGEDFQFAPQVFPSSLGSPAVAETREALKERIIAVKREARIYGMHSRPRSPMRKNPHAEVEIRDLERRAARLRGGR